MKKTFIFAASALFAGAAFAQHYDREDAVLTPEQLKLTAAAAPKRLAATPKKVRRFLVWDRTDGYRHTEGIPAFNALLRELVKNSGGKWEADFAQDPKAFELDNLKKYDCVILNNTTGRFFTSFKDEREKMTPEQRKADDRLNIKYRDNLIKYVEDGGGVMGMHAACDAMDCKDDSNPAEKFPAYPEMMGGRFAGHPWGAGNPAVTVLVEDPENAVLRGLWENGVFKIQDEIYTFREDYGYSRDKQRILLALDFDRSPRGDGRDPMLETQRKTKDFGLSWVKKFGKGRIFYGAFGHRLDVYWRNPKICEMYMRGLQFASGDLDDVETAPLGDAPRQKALANAAVVSIYALRDIDFGDKLDSFEASFFDTYKAVLSSPETAAKVEKLCADELAAKSGTLRYKKLLSELLQVAGAKNCAKEIASVIARDAPDAKNRYYVESLFIALARAKTPESLAALESLSKSKIEFVALDAISAMAYGKDPAAAAPIAAALNKALSSGNERMSQCAASALAFIGSAESYERLASALKNAKSPLAKSQIQKLLMSGARANPKLAQTVANEIYNDKTADKGSRTLAAILLMKSGKDVSGDIYLSDLIRVLAEDKSVKIPASFALGKLPQENRAEMVYALAKRGEGYESIIALDPADAGTAKAITYAISVFGKISDMERAASFAELYDNDDMRITGFVMASVKAKGKLKTFSDLAAKLQGRPRELVVSAMSNLDASSSVDYLFKIVSGDAPEGDKLAAIKSLENAVLKNSEVFVRAAKLYPAVSESLKKPLMGLMVACSRRECDASMVNAALGLFEHSANPKEKAAFLRFAVANNGEAGAKMCVAAYKAGLKNQALAEISKWNNSSAFKPLMGLDKSLKNPAERKAVQAALVSVISKSGEVESDAASYILKNAVDKKSVKTVQKLQRLNLKNVKLMDLGGGVIGTSFKNAGELKNAFDGSRGSRWSSGENRAPGQWIHFELPKPRLISAVVLDLHTSKGDGIIDPKLYVGESIEDFDQAAVSATTENGKNVLKLKKPAKAKIVRIENGGEAGGWWSIHEIEFVDDPAVYTNALKPVKGGLKAGANCGENEVKQAFDGNMGSRWSTNGARQPGQWFMFAYDKPKKVSEINLHLGDSAGDRVLKPKLYAGNTAEDMKPVEIKYSSARGMDVLKLATPANAKMFRIENCGSGGGFWSIHEIEVK